MEKERFLVEVTVKGEKDWKADGWKGAKITWQSILAK